MVQGPDDPDATAVFAAVDRRPARPLPPLPPLRSAGRHAAASGTQTFTRPPEFVRPPVPSVRPATPPVPERRPATAAVPTRVAVPPPVPAPPPPPPPPPTHCRCGAEPIGTCEECSLPVCGDHSTLWRGWRVCDRDLAEGQERSRRQAEEEERRVKEATAAAKAEAERLRNTPLDLTPEQALHLLYEQEPRTEQQVRSAVHVLRRVPSAWFTELCLDVLRKTARRTKTRRGLIRRSGWAVSGEHFHDRSWFLTRGGTWYRSGSYGESGAEQGYSGRKVRLDDTEKRAIIYDMAWQHERNGFLP
jgi:hypothetical protein